MKLFTIPNIITLLNLLCGCMAIVFAFDGNLVWSAYLVGIAAVLDFFDGFVARALKQYSEIGKQLDSLADMVTFGVVPGVVMFMLLQHAFEMQTEPVGSWDLNKALGHSGIFQYPLALIAFIIPLFSALRLAKFNIDTRQSDSFIGVPTPANSIFICSLPLVFTFVNYRNSDTPAGFDLAVMQLIANSWFLISATIIMSVLLISEIPLFSLKFKSFGWKGNEIRWSFLGMSVILLATLQLVGIPLAIVLYIILSIVNTRLIKK